MTTLRDIIHDVLTAYQKQQEGAADNLDELEDNLVDEIRDYFTRVIG